MSFRAGHHGLDSHKILSDHDATHNSHTKPQKNWGNPKFLKLPGGFDRAAKQCAFGPCIPLGLCFTGDAYEPIITHRSFLILFIYININRYIHTFKHGYADEIMDV